MQHWCRCWHEADVSLRDVTISRDGKQGYKVRVTSRTGSARRILGISKKVGELKLNTEWDGWLSLARRGQTNLRATGGGGGGRWKRQHRKIVSLSLCRRTFKLKGNKRFVPELRSRYVFFVFRDSYVLMYVSHIAVSGYGTQQTLICFTRVFVLNAMACKDELGLRSHMCSNQ